MNKTCSSWNRSKMLRSERSRGFGALISVLIVSSGALAMSFTALDGAESYSDAVFHKEMRIQASLDAVACADSAALIRAKDRFASGTARIEALGCSILLSK